MRGSDSFAYDQANRLTSATVSGTTTTNYVYDINASLPNVLTDGTLKYVYGLGLAYAVDTSGNVQVYHEDGLGSVRVITDGSANVIESYLTDAFGAPSQTQGTSTQPFQFTGQQRDAEDGLYYLRARMYDPSIGRFLSRDAVFGSLTNPFSLSRFDYALDNPILLSDPSGLLANRVTQDPCSDPMNLLPWFCGDNVVRMNPFGVLRMNPFDRDILNALEGALGSDEARYASSGSGPSGSAGSSNTRPIPLWPKTADEMDAFLGFSGKRVPDTAQSPGRSKVVWNVSDKVTITYEQHPYDTTAPDWHKNPHWHLDLPGAPHRRYLPGDRMPGF